jgi:prepilin-type N-terminal cleavage/methylation domain-containing protein
MLKRIKLKAFTMVEIMIVIAIIVGLSALYFAKNFSAYEKTTIQSTISKDVETVMEAVENYKYNDYTNSRGGYNVGGTAATGALNDVIRPFLPESMTSDGGSDIQSLGMGGRVKYTVSVNSIDQDDGIQKHYTLKIDSQEESISSGWDKPTCELALTTFRSAINRRMMTKKGEATGSGAGGQAPDAVSSARTASASGACTVTLDKIRQ